MKPTKNSLTRKLDIEFSRIVRSRGVCEWGITKNCTSQYDKLQTAHIYSRTYKSVRWDLDNALCLCAGCHFYAHKRPMDFAQHVLLWLGAFKYEMLKQRANSIKRWTVPDMQELLNTFAKTV
jgi:hypothetical protein